MKKILSKIGEAITDTYNFLDGKKRRIAVLCGFVMTITPPHTIAYQAANIGLLIFGGADALNVSKKFVVKKLNRNLE